MNLTQIIEATVEFWRSHYEIVGIAVPINVYNQLRAENNAFVVSASQIIYGNAAAQIAGTMVTIVPDKGCFRVITGEPLPTVQSYDPSKMSMGGVLEAYRRGLVSMKEYQAEFVDDAPPPGLVWES